MANAALGQHESRFDLTELVLTGLQGNTECILVKLFLPMFTLCDDAAWMKGSVGVYWFVKSQSELLSIMFVLSRLTNASLWKAGAHKWAVCPLKRSSAVTFVDLNCSLSSVVSVIFGAVSAAMFSAAQRCQSKSAEHSRIKDKKSRKLPQNVLQHERYQLF